MLRSSLGFHTTTLFLRLNHIETRKLIEHFYCYLKQTKLIRMLIIEYTAGGCRGWKEYSPQYIHDGNTLLLPLELKINYSGKDHGIRWTIRANTQSDSFRAYTVEATINPKILSGTNDYITAATFDDLRFVTHKFNSISNSISPFLGCFQMYQIKRIDYCVNFDVSELAPHSSSDQVMNLIRRGDMPPHFEEWMEYDASAHRMKPQRGSFYLKCNSVNINCYQKSVELHNRNYMGRPSVAQSTVDSAREIIRFEVQYKYHKVYNVAKQTSLGEDSTITKYDELLSCRACLVAINYYYAKIIGSGDWYSLSRAKELVKMRHYNAQKERRLINALEKVNQCRSLAGAKATYQGNDLAAFKRTVNDLCGIGINPVTIPKNWGVSHIPNLMHTFNERFESKLACPELNAYLV